MATAAAHPALTPPRSEEISRGLRWSLTFHLVVFGIIVFKTLVFPGTPIAFTPALRVDIVGLPDILKKDLSQIPKTPPAEEPKKAEPIPPPPPVKTKAPPPKEMAEPDEMVLKPTAQQEKTREKKMKSALDRIKALEKISEEEDDAKPAGAVIKGNKVSKGTSLSPDAKEAAEASYYDAVRDKLQENWALPVWLARQKLDAQVLIRIDPTGHVSALSFMKLSGNAQFDAQVKKAVGDSQPFPTPPVSVIDAVGSRGVLVGFPL